MQTVGELLATMMDRAASSAGRQSYSAIAEESDGMTLLDLEAHRAERYNRERGDLDPAEYDCKKCLNRGHIAEAFERNGMVYTAYPECDCMGIRRSLWRLKKSGLEKAVRAQTFKAFHAVTDWQRQMVDVAKRYLNDPDGAKSGAWLYIGGAVGCGKTHICTAVAGQLMIREKLELRYVTWPGDSARIKSVANDAEQYSALVEPLKTVPVLYIDDFFKPLKDGMGAVKPPTAADIKLAYEIINQRYINRAPTIISAERYLSELEDIDMAVASRIAERSRGYCLSIGRDRSKNYRYGGDAS